MKLTVNGTEHALAEGPERSLLEVLRDELGLRSPKDGCSPQATCGSCAVELEGKVVYACATPVEKAEGKRVRTLEGFDERVRDALAEGFAAGGGSQCGFCIPGIALRAACLLEQGATPSAQEIERELRFHLCRCTGYKKIVSSIQGAAARLAGGAAAPAPPGSGRVGTREPKVRIREAVLGQQQYVTDLCLDGMLHGALRLSDHPRARVLRIDASAARAMPGVEGVYLASDVPGARQVGLIVADWPVLVAEGEETRYVGDVVACVAASDRRSARAAAAAIEVQYEVLEPLCDVDQALAEGAPALHPGGNLLSTSVVQRGDVDEALARCAHVTSGTYTTQRIEHGYMEPEAALARPHGADGVHLYSQSQGVYEDRRQLASLLGLEQERVVVELVPNGGGFGGKEDLSVQGHAALMARLTGRAVHVELSREESIRMHPKRHPLRLAYELGCDAEGRLLALRARIDGDTGAYASVGAKVLERAAGHASGAYHVPNIDVVARAVYTNNVPCGAMRGFGANQAAFALECAVDELCELGGFDRWQLRWDNALVEGGRTATGQLLSSGVGVRATLEAVRERFQAARYAGIACGLKNTGIGNGMPDAGTARVVVLAADHVEVQHGWTEMGQGVDTMALQTLCEETGLLPSIVTVRTRTDDETPCGMTTASRATSLVGNAVIDACRGLKRDLERHDLRELVGREYRGEWVCDWTNKPGHSKTGEEVTHYSYSYATQVVILGDDGSIAEVIAAHDAGRVMNPTLFEGQIEGSVHMGLGYALSEDLPMEGAQLVSTKLRACGILRAAQTPPITVIGVECPDEHGPYGAKGVGEIGLVPTAPAVANALWSFDGERRRSLPMKGAARR